MESGVFVLVLLSAVGHAGWNLAARKVSGNFVVLWLSAWTGALALTPVVLVVAFRAASWSWTPVGVACVIATGVIHALYFIALARAYSSGEISVVYPIARGSGIGVTALLAWMLLSEEVSLPGALGIGLVFVGILVMGAPAFRRQGNVEGLRLALTVGLTIPAYSIIDKVGVSLVHPIVYIWFMYLLSALCLWPLIHWRHRGQAMGVWQQHRNYVLVIGLGASLTYLAILFAYQLGPVGYIAALREVAVVIGAVLGIVFLKEEVSLAKLVAVAAIAAGVICIKLG